MLCMYLIACFRVWVCDVPERRCRRQAVQHTICPDSGENGAFYLLVLYYLFDVTSIFVSECVGVVNGMSKR